MMVYGSEMVKDDTDDADAISAALIVLHNADPEELYAVYDMTSKDGETTRVFIVREGEIGDKMHERLLELTAEYMKEAKEMMAEHTGMLLRGWGTDEPPEG